VAPTNAAEGVYLLAVQVDMPGYGITKPIFVVPGTYGLISTSLPTLEAAVAWVELNASVLIRDGDYNFNGAVDAADQATWTQQFGSSGPWPINGDFADGNRDAIANAADYVIWRKFLGTGPGGSPGSHFVGVPEPALSAMAGWLAVVSLLPCRNRQGGRSTLSDHDSQTQNHTIYSVLAHP
jgi:hypothetical protein